MKRLIPLLLLAACTNPREAAMPDELLIGYSVGDIPTSGMIGGQAQQIRLPSQSVGEVDAWTVGLIWHIGEVATARQQEELRKELDRQNALLMEILAKPVAVLPPAAPVEVNVEQPEVEAKEPEKRYWGMTGATMEKIGLGVGGVLIAVAAWIGRCKVVAKKKAKKEEEEVANANGA